MSATLSDGARRLVDQAVAQGLDERVADHAAIRFLAEVLRDNAELPEAAAHIFPTTPSASTDVRDRDGT